MGYFCKSICIIASYVGFVGSFICFKYITLALAKGLCSFSCKSCKPYHERRPLGIELFALITGSNSNELKAKRPQQPKLSNQIKPDETSYLPQPFLRPYFGLRTSSHVVLPAFYVFFSRQSLEILGPTPALHSPTALQPGRAPRGSHHGEHRLHRHRGRAALPGEAEVARHQRRAPEPWHKVVTKIRWLFDIIWVQMIHILDDRLSVLVEVLRLFWKFLLLFKPNNKMLIFVFGRLLCGSICRPAPCAWCSTALHVWVACTYDYVAFCTSLVFQLVFHGFSIGKNNPFRPEKRQE